MLSGMQWAPGGSTAVPADAWWPAACVSRTGPSPSSLCLEVHWTAAGKSHSTHLISKPINYNLTLYWNNMAPCPPGWEERKGNSAWKNGLYKKINNVNGDCSLIHLIYKKKLCLGCILLSLEMWWDGVGGGGGVSTIYTMATRAVGSMHLCA